MALKKINNAVGNTVSATAPSGATETGFLPAVQITDASGNPVNGTGTSANQVQGTSANGAVDDGSNPVKTGAIVVSGTVAAKTAGNRTDLTTDLLGNLRVLTSGLTAAVADLGSAQYSVLATVNKPATAGGPLLVLNSVWDGTFSYIQRGDANGTVVQPGVSSTYWNTPAGASGIVNTTTALTIKAASGAGLRNYVTAIQIDHDTLGGATEVVIRDGAAGTVLWRGKLQTAAKEGSTMTFPVPLRGTANTLLEVATLTAVTGGVYVNVQGFIGT